MPLPPPTISLSFSSSSSSIFLQPLPLPRRLSASPYTLVKRLGFWSELATVPVISFSGERVGEASLDLKVAPPDTARAVVHRGLITDQQNARRGTASTLTRGEVRGGGKKPYPQKKTGRARRGSQRTPLRPGGGVVFGPKPRDWSIKINRKEKRLAISTAITSAAAAADALVVEDLEDQFREGPKTREFVAAMMRWGLDPKKKSMFLMMEVPDNVRLSCRNIGTLKMLTPRTLNLFDVLDAEKLVFTRDSLDYLNAIYGDSGSSDDRDDDEEEEEEQEPLVAGSRLLLLFLLSKLLLRPLSALPFSASAADDQTVLTIETSVPFTGHKIEPSPSSWAEAPAAPGERVAPCTSTRRTPASSGCTSTFGSILQ